MCQLETDRERNNWIRQQVEIAERKGLLEAKKKRKTKSVATRKPRKDNHQSHGSRKRKEKMKLDRQCRHELICHWKISTSLPRCQRPARGLWRMSELVSEHIFQKKIRYCHRRSICSPRIIPTEQDFASTLAKECPNDRDTTVSAIETGILLRHDCSDARQV